MPPKTRKSIGRRTVRGALLAIAIAGAFFFTHQIMSRAEVRELTPKATFLSGGARSEIQLMRIAAILERMEARLARIEKLMAQPDRRRDQK